MMTDRLIVTERKFKGECVYYLTLSNSIRTVMVNNHFKILLNKDWVDVEEYIDSTSADGLLLGVDDAMNKLLSQFISQHRLKSQTRTIDD